MHGGRVFWGTQPRETMQGVELGRADMKWAAPELCILFAPRVDVAKPSECVVRAESQPSAAEGRKMS
jgi:hypothetical protein